MVGGSAVVEAVALVAGEGTAWACTWGSQTPQFTSDLWSSLGCRQPPLALAPGLLGSDR